MKMRQECGETGAIWDSLRALNKASSQQVSGKYTVALDDSSCVVHDREYAPESNQTYRRDEDLLDSTGGSSVSKLAARRFSSRSVALMQKRAQQSKLPNAGFVLAEKDACSDFLGGGPYSAISAAGPAIALSAPCRSYPRQAGAKGAEPSSCTVRRYVPVKTLQSAVLTRVCLCLQKRVNLTSCS